MAYETRDVLDRVDRFPRVDIIHRPTPLRKLERLSARLGGPEIYVKRDDLTGLAFGGNKSRKLEFIIPDMLDKKADVVITWASLQSNWCMQTAAAARTFGIKPVLVLFKTYDLPAAADGNLLLDVILEADIRVLEAEKAKVVKSAQAFAVLEEAAREVRAQGHRPYLVPVGGSLVRGDMDKPLGAVSYVAAFAEIIEEMRAAGSNPDFIVHSTGSGGTQAGLVVGARALTRRCRVIGISVSDPKGPFSDDVLEIARAADEALGLGLGILPDDVTVFDEYMGQGYGVVDKAVAETIRLVFQTEGIVLDPVYTAKAMIGLRDLIKTGFFKTTDKVVFLHTGGTPALFPNRDKIFNFLVQESLDRAAQAARPASSPSSGQAVDLDRLRDEQVERLEAAPGQDEDDAAFAALDPSGGGELLQGGERRRGFRAGRRGLRAAASSRWASSISSSVTARSMSVALADHPQDGVAGRRGRDWRWRGRSSGPRPAVRISEALVESADERGAALGLDADDRWDRSVIKPSRSRSAKPRMRPSRCPPELSGTTTVRGARRPS